MNKYFLIIQILLLSIFLSGCSMSEIEEYSIVAGIGIDYKDSKYQVTYEIYKENNGETTSLNSIIKTAEGLTISEAISNIDNKIHQTPYLNHCLLIVLGEEIVKEKLDNTLNYFIHDVRIRSSCYVVSTVNESAKTLLSKSQEIKQVVSYNLYKKLDQLPKQASIWNDSNFDFIMNEKLDENGTIIIPIAIYKEDFSLTNCYIIKNDNSVYKINNEETFIIQLFSDNVDEGLIKINDKFIYLKSSKTKILGNDNTFTLDVYMQVLSYDDLGIDLTDDFQRKEMIKLLEQELSKQIYEVFIKYQTKEVDVFGIYKYLQKYNTNFYNKIKKEYYEYYQKIQLKTNITIDLLTSGLSEERI